MTVKLSTRASGALLSMVLGLSAGAGAWAQPQPFNFKNVEYMPHDQRVPAAQAFLAQAVTPGMPLTAAKATLEQAGAYCPAIRPDASLHCTHASMQRHPGDDEQDVIWKIDVQGDGAGRVMTATVRRTVRGV